MHYFYTLYFFFILFVACTNNSSKKPENESVISKEIYIYETEEGLVFDEKKHCLVKFCDSCTETNAKAKYRGGSSSKYHKHSFTVKLAKDTTLTKVDLQQKTIFLTLLTLIKH